MEKRKALISVYYKDGITESAQELISLGFDIVASGNTANHLKKAGLPVIDVAELVGGGAILGHRVLTLAREVHAGLLAQYNEKDRQEMIDLLISYLDLVYVGLYPLEKTINDPNSTPADVIESTDMGGIALIRSAAKGRRIDICDSSDFPQVIEWLKAGEPEREEFLNMLAGKAEYVAANYCLLSANYTSHGKYAGIIGEKVCECKGENGYQVKAALYKLAGSNNDPLALHKFKLISGEALSYNNWCDLDRLIQTATHIAAAFEVNRNDVPFFAIGVKHGNACGAAIDCCYEMRVLERTLTGDSLALFGGLVLCNFHIDYLMAECILHYGLKTEPKRILDAIIAPSFSDSAVALLERKKGKCRLIANEALSFLGEESLDQQPIFRPVRGGFLKQPNYTFILNLQDPQLVKYGQATEEQEDDMLLAKAIGDTSNSNAITLVKNGQLLGNGTGQQSRRDCVELAVKKAENAHHDPEGGVIASDSFFPFADGPELADMAGIQTIFSTSGSVRDKDVINFCQENGIVLYLIPDAIGRGFFNH
jgi:phosphoribosylaminoimidazolecarboxamide formyltransferase/IMP cyclohydrolase